LNPLSTPFKWTSGPSVFTRPRRRADLGWAYCAGGGETCGYGGGTFVWNLTGDPTDPAWVGLVDDPRLMYHHQAIAGADGEVLYVGDESLGPNCNRPAGEALPTAALWAFDVWDPARPEVLGHVQADREPRPSDTVGGLGLCGAHLGGRLGDTGSLTWSWWSAGTVLVDATDPSSMTIRDRVGDVGVVNDALHHAGFVYTGAEDLVVLEVTGDG
jgi:hypothetical protein